jgi:hypothetical protein
MKKLLLFSLLALVSNITYSQQNYYDVTPGNGYGIRLWASDWYKIHMGNSSEYLFGPVTDYSIKSNMTENVGRGWTWGIAGQTPIAGLNNAGHMTVAGDFTSKGLFFYGSGNAPDGKPFARFTEAYGIRFSSPDTRWVFSSKPSVLIGYMPDGTAWGNDNLFVLGNVGIGTNTPEAKLHVNGDIRVPISAKIVLGTAAGGYGEYIQNYQTGIGLYTNSARRVVIDNIGNVGIGTSSPNQKLNIFDGNISLKVASNSNTQGLLFQNSGSSYVWAIQRTGVSSADLQFNGGASSDPNSMATRVVFKNNGNVGIGTSTPDSKLTVKGVIHAEEVKVDLSVPGPDYVFASDYPLASLEDTKAYIEQNKHLPGIPSSDEMQQNGVNLLEMNMKLLEKVEELTLYVIEQKKMHTNLESTLLQKIEALETKLKDLRQ